MKPEHYAAARRIIEEISLLDDGKHTATNAMAEGIAIIVRELEYARMYGFSEGMFYATTQYSALGEIAMEN
jgi:hypothetical protein